jgi:porphobilinogen synthase
MLHSSFSTSVIKSWNCASKVDSSNLVYPLFIIDTSYTSSTSPESKQEIKSMPGQFRWGASEDRLREALDEPVKNGLQSVLLFGVVDDISKKDNIGSFADNPESPVILALKILRRLYPQLTLLADVCLCGYTSHGHCGIFTNDMNIDNEASITRLSTIAVAYARAGAHVIAPSDMMDGRVGAIKAALRATDEKLSSRVAVMSYAAKFASCFYGPFRDAAHSGMTFGDRSLYQLPPGSRSLALRAVDRDIAEGADFIMVKPGGPYLDICRDVVNAYGDRVPIAVYQVSGEFAMLHHAAAAGAFDLRRAVEESLMSFRRSGVTIIITYFAPQVLEWNRVK